MQKIVHFMKSTKGLVLTAVMLFGVLFFAFINHAGTTDPQKQRLLEEIGRVLEQQHYSPRAIDDSFSKAVFQKYLDELDGDKMIFLESDIRSLKKFETKIDDEIHGSEIKFTPAVNIIYDKRIPEAITLYKEILSNPFDFTVDETVEIDPQKINYPVTEAERKDRWRKKLKYLVLERYVDLTDERDKSTVDSIKSKTNTQLELEARVKVLKTMNRVYDRIKAKFDNEERFNTFINVIVHLMDPHTDYFPPVEKRSFDEGMSGRFYGIGAQLSEQDGNVKIVSVLTGGPAWKSGVLMANDVILKVGQGNEEPVDIAGYDVTDAVKLIRGDKGTEVRLTVKRQDGTVKVIPLVRDEIVQDESFARSAVIQNENDKIGYIYLPQFYADFEKVNGAHCSEDVKKEVEKLKAENVNGIVLDLRFNPGGSLYEVVQMLGLFIKEGPVVQVRERDGRVSVMSDRDGKIIYDGPLTVMINEGSASASEIFAAAIQDYKRGIVLGSTSSFGKGTVQRPVSLGKKLDFFSDQSEFGIIKLTFQKFYRINGGSTQVKGVVPDVLLPDVYDYMKIREKDDPSALPWDEIEKAPYQVWESKYDIASVIRKVNASVDTSSAFNTIKTTTQWMGEIADKPVDLQIDKYKEHQKKIHSMVEQSTTASKLPYKMKVEALEIDKNKFYNNPDKGKGERYQDWLKGLKNDLYIEQAVKAVSNLIAAQSQETVNK